MSVLTDMRIAVRQLSDKSWGWWTDVANMSAGAHPCTHNPSTLENNLTVFKKIKHIPTMWFSHSSPIYLPSRPGICVHMNTCTQIFSAAWFERVPNWKPPRCPDTGEWMTRLQKACSRNGIQLSNQKDIEVHGLLTHQTKWVYPKVVTLSERSQVKGYMVLFALKF